MNCIIYAVKIDDVKKIGLHARPASKIAGAISKYKDTEVKVIKLNDNVDITKPVVVTGNETTANAKSVLNFLGLQVTNNNKIAFIITGPDAENAKTLIKKVLIDEELIK